MDVIPVRNIHLTVIRRRKPWIGLHKSTESCFTTSSTGCGESKNWKSLKNGTRKNIRSRWTYHRSRSREKRVKSKRPFEGRPTEWQTVADETAELNFIGDKIMSKTIGEILIEKLTPNELSILCKAHDDGTLNDVFYGELLPEDQANFPLEYCQVDELGNQDEIVLAEDE